MNMHTFSYNSYFSCTHLLVCCCLEVCEESPNLAQLSLALSQHLLGALKLMAVAVPFKTTPQLLKL